MRIERGMILEEIYAVKETFESGGMGLVHRTRHLLWNIDVAIKHPRPEFLTDQKHVAAFYSECETWAEIGLHANIATCYYTREINNLPCVVAEFVPDGSLQDAISRRILYRGSEEESLSRMLVIAASSAWGLHRAHQAGLLHCDVKPHNMLLASHGIAKISDFGITVAFNRDGAQSTGLLTREFASPEQSRGERLFPSTDIWSWAVSMLAMFTGDIYWDSGTVCGSVLRQFIDDGAKAYRIPVMPPSLCNLLGRCFRFSPDERPSSFDLIANEVCDCYEKFFGEPCPAGEPDLQLISADSLNNRAVSKSDLKLKAEVKRLLAEALAVDPLHPEANFNSAWLGFLEAGTISETSLKNLETVTRYDLGEYRPHLYRACLLNLKGRVDAAALALEQAVALANEAETKEIRRMWDLSQRKGLHVILAPPMSGEDLALDAERFNRLMEKCKIALEESRHADAKRYLMMSGDIPSFSRHPRRRELILKI